MFMEIEFLEGTLLILRAYKELVRWDIWNSWWGVFFSNDTLKCFQKTSPRYF